MFGIITVRLQLQNFQNRGSTSISHLCGKIQYDVYHKKAWISQQNNVNHNPM